MRTISPTRSCRGKATMEAANVRLGDYALGETGDR